MATFQASGNTPEEMVRLKAVFSEFEIAEAAILRKYPSTPSNPMALFDFSRERLDSTSCSLMGGIVKRGALEGRLDATNSEI